MISDAQEGNSWGLVGKPSIIYCRSCVKEAKHIGEPKEVLDELILAVRDITETNRTAMIHYKAPRDAIITV